MKSSTEQKPEGHGNQLLGRIAVAHPSDVPIDVVKAALVEAGGNVSAAARALGASRPTFVSAVRALGLMLWLHQTWPERGNGGRPVPTPSDLDPRVKAAIRDGTGLVGLSEREAEIVRRRYVNVPSETTGEIAAHLGVTKQSIARIEKAALAKIEARLTRGPHNEND